MVVPRGSCAPAAASPVAFAGPPGQAPPGTMAAWSQSQPNLALHAHNCSQKYMTVYDMGNQMLT